MESLTLLTVTVYSDILRGDKSLAKYFASWYDSVLILQIIGRIGRSSTVYLGCTKMINRDDKSHLYDHAEKTGYENVNIDHFKILSNGDKNNKFKRKLVEALHIKHERPTLNVQEQSVPIKLFK